MAGFRRRRRDRVEPAACFINNAWQVNRTVAIFGKKKQSDASGVDDGQGAESGAAYTSDPVKARRFFERAETVHDSSQYGYAMTLWLQGLLWDPTSMSALEKFARSAAGFVEENQNMRLLERM